MNLVEIKKRLNGSELLPIIEVLLNKNDILTDLQYTPANNGGSHKYIRRFANGTGEWKGLNEGVTPTTSQTDLKEESLAFYENVASFDVNALKLANASELRDQEVNNKIEELGDQIAASVFYGSGIDKNPLGLKFRDEFSALSSAQVIGADGTGSYLSSAYIITNDIANGLFVAHAPEGAAGIEVDDMGVVSQGTTTKSRVHDIYVTWNGAIVVANHKNIARVANIQTDSTSNYQTVQLALIDALANIKNPNPSTVIYVNKDVQAIMDKGAFSQSNMFWTPGDFGGNVVARFKGFAVKRCDAIVTGETVVS
jgi:hypothetical protein